MDGLSVQVTLGDPDVPPERMLEICIDYAEAALGAELAADEVVA